MSAAASLLAPIALFAFKRPRHTEWALKSLLANPEAMHSPLHIFCDGPRNAIDAVEVAALREVVRKLAPKHAVVLERESNLGLDRSIIAGVSQLCANHGRVIVMEDDLEVAPDFLAYLNAALTRYADEPRVMQVSAYQFPVSIPATGSATNAAVLLPYATSWGWATWQRAWQPEQSAAPMLAALKDDAALRRRFDLDGSYPYFRMLKRNLEKPVPAWDISFYARIFAQQGLAVHPRVSRVRNNGFDGSGSTCGRYATQAIRLDAGPGDWRFPPAMQVDDAAYSAIKRHLGRESSLPMKLMRRIEARLPWLSPQAASARDAQDARSTI